MSDLCGIETKTNMSQKLEVLLVQASINATEGNRVFEERRKKGKFCKNAEKKTKFSKTQKKAEGRRNIKLCCMKGVDLLH